MRFSEYKYPQDGFNPPNACASSHSDRTSPNSFLLKRLCVSGKAFAASSFSFTSA
jgi:hypothetical protein